MSDNRSDHFILFIVAGTTYALPSHDVAHVEMVEQITRVPNAPPSSMASCSRAARSCRP